MYVSCRPNKNIVYAVGVALGYFRLNRLFYVRVSKNMSHSRTLLRSNILRGAKTRNAWFCTVWDNGVFMFENSEWSSHNILPSTHSFLYQHFHSSPWSLLPCPCSLTGPPTPSPTTHSSLLHTVTHAGTPPPTPHTNQYLSSLHFPRLTPPPPSPLPATHSITTFTNLLTTVKWSLLIFHSVCH